MARGTRWGAAGKHRGGGCEAIAEMLSGKSQLVLGWVRPRLERELKRLVRQRVRRLHARKETQAVRSEWEFLAPDENGELVSVLELMPDTGTNENGLKAERAEARKGIKEELEQSAFTSK